MCVPWGEEKASDPDRKKHPYYSEVNCEKLVYNLWRPHNESRKEVIFWINILDGIK